MSSLPSFDPIVSCEHPSIQLYAADCLRGMQSLIEDQTVSVVVTSPPYNIGVSYQSYQDDLPQADYLAWMENVSTEITRVLEPDGSPFLNLGSTLKDPWLAWTVADQFRSSLVLQNVIHWVKSIAIDKVDLGTDHLGRSAFAAGHFKPVPGHRLLHSCHEYIFHFTKTGQVQLDRPRDRRAVSGQEQRRAMAGSGAGPPVSGQCLVHALQDHPRPREPAAAPGHVPAAVAGALVFGSTASRQSGGFWTRSSDRDRRRLRRNA